MARWLDPRSTRSLPTAESVPRMGRAAVSVASLGRGSEACCLIVSGTFRVAPAVVRGDPEPGRGGAACFSDALEARPRFGVSVRACGRRAGPAATSRAEEQRRPAEERLVFGRCVGPRAPGRLQLGGIRALAASLTTYGWAQQEPRHRRRPAGLLRWLARCARPGRGRPPGGGPARGGETGGARRSRADPAGSVRRSG